MRALALSLLFSCLFTSGCNSDSDTGATKSRGSETEQKTASRGTIGVSLLTLENPFFKVIGDTITAEAKKHGYETIVLSADNDPAKQSDQVQNFIVQKVSYIVLSPRETRSIVPSVQAANEAGIPVITVDIPCYEEGVEFLTQIATDNYSGGKKAGEAMIEALGDQNSPKIAILEMKATESCRLRDRGFREVIKTYNETADENRKIQIAGSYESEGKKEVGLKATEDAIQADPDLDGIFAINDPAALGARAALEKANKAEDIVIIGFDGQPEGKQAIKEGKIYADPIQYPDKMGEKVVESIVAHSKGEEVPPEQLIPTTLYRQEDALNDPELN